MSKDTEPSALDGGFGWLVLAASFINQVILLGYVKAAGIFFVEWQEYFGVGSREVGWVGILLAFFGPGAGLVAGGLNSKFGARPVAVVGGVLTAVAVACQSFSTSLWHIYLLSIISSIGLGFTFQSSISVVGFYFKRRIGIANGVAFSGVGAGIVVMPPLVQILCTKFGWDGALLILGAIILVTVLLSLTFRPTERENYFIMKSMEERLHPQEAGGVRKMACLSSSFNHLGVDLVWRYPRFGVLVLSYALAGFGYFASVVFFTSRAVYDAGIPKREAAFLVSAIGVGSTIGRAGHGFLIHTGVISIAHLYIVSGFATAVSSFLNPVSNTLLTLFVCAGSFGLFSGAMLAVSLMCAREFVPAASVSRSLGVLILANGIGIVFGTFTMGYLNDATGNYALSFIAAGVGFTLASVFLMGDLIYDYCSPKPPPEPPSDELKDPEARRDQEGALFLNEDGVEVKPVPSAEEKKLVTEEPESSV